MTEFEDARVSQLADYRAKLADSARRIKHLYENPRGGLKAAYEPILKEWEHPICPVPRSTALNLFLDLSMLPTISEPQRLLCHYSMVTMPGKNFADAAWIVEVLEDLETIVQEEAEALIFPPPKMGGGDLLAAMDDAHGSAGGGEGPLVPSVEGPSGDDSGGMM